MKIGIISSTVPFVNGGYRFIADWLEVKLRERGHAVETVYIPSTDDPNTLLAQMAAFQSIQLSESFDLAITLRPPAHLIQHPRKVVWFIHHIRIFYDLWDSPYRPFPATISWNALREQIMRADTNALRSAQKVFSNSRVVADRLRQFNGIDAEVLYPPVFNSERFQDGDYGNEIVCVCRMEHHKRQHLLVDAMGHTRTSVRLRLCGPSSNPDYAKTLAKTAGRHGVQDRVVIDNRWITEDEKVSLLRNALASAYVPLDEDSYGYPTIEAAHSRRCTVTVSDAGGVLEFVTDGSNGLVVPPDPAMLGMAFDRLNSDRAMAREMGDAASQRIADLGIDWDTVIAKLLG